MRDARTWLLPAQLRTSFLESDLATSSQVEAGHSREIVTLVVALLLIVTKMYLEYQMFVKRELDKMLHK